MKVYEKISQSTSKEMAESIYDIVKLCANACGGCRIGVQDDAGCIRCIDDMLNRNATTEDAWRVSDED